MRAYHLLRLIAQQHRITLLAFGHPGAAETITPLNAFCETVRVVSPTVVDSATFRFRGLLSPMPRHLVQSTCPEMSREIARYIGNTEVAIGMQLEAARYLGPWTRLPRVFEEAEMTVLRDQYVNERHYARRARRFLTWTKSARFMRRLVGEFDRTTVVSELERQQLRHAGCDVGRVAIVANGTEVPKEMFTGVPHERLIYPGAVTYSANLDAMRFFIREIFPLVRRQRPQMELWITGSSDGVDTSELMVPGVRMTGHVLDVEPMIAQSAACIIPLRIGGGTRLKALQAMALGTPVVSTSKGVEGLAVTPEQHLLVADTPQAFAAQILRVCGNDALRRDVTAAAGKFVREYHAWPASSAALNEVINAAVDEHRRTTSHTLP